MVSHSCTNKSKPALNFVTLTWETSGSGYYEPPSYNVYDRLCRNYMPCAEEMEIWENL